MNLKKFILKQWMIKKWKVIRSNNQMAISHFEKEGTVNLLDQDRVTLILLICQ